MMTVASHFFAASATTRARLLSKQAMSTNLFQHKNAWRNLSRCSGQELVSAHHRTLTNTAKVSTKPTTTVKRALPGRAPALNDDSEYTLLVQLTKQIHQRVKMEAQRAAVGQHSKYDWVSRLLSVRGCRLTRFPQHAYSADTPYSSWLLLSLLLLLALVAI
jgi:hypothetical protein